MLALLQRVDNASVTINKDKIANINRGLLILCGFMPYDNTVTVRKMLNKCLNYRLFADQDDKMNLSLMDIQGELLLVPQFTLAANTDKGLRPSFSSAAEPTLGLRLFTELCSYAKELEIKVEFGQFGADMQVTLCNNGPVTFILHN